MLVDRFEIFAGPLFLGNPLGSIYRDHQQTGDITFASGPDATPLGSATIKIIANGDDINVPAAWLLVGGDEISQHQLMKITFSFYAKMLMWFITQTKL